MTICGVSALRPSVRPSGEKPRGIYLPDKRALGKSDFSGGLRDGAATGGRPRGLLPQCACAPPLVLTEEPDIYRFRSLCGWRLLSVLRGGRTAERRKAKPRNQPTAAAAVAAEGTQMTSVPREERRWDDSDSKQDK